MRFRPGGRPRLCPTGHRRKAGFSLVELVLALALIAILALATVPPLLSAAAATRVRLAAGELVSVLRQARSEAVTRGQRVGVKFFVDGEQVEFGLFADGDGDGVRSADIDDGSDPPLGPRRRLSHLGRTVTFGFPPGRAPRDPSDPSRRLRRLDDPVRFNRSDVASFGPLGTSTPGSLYVTDGDRQLAVVRLWGRTAKVKVLTYDPVEEVWW